MSAQAFKHTCGDIGKQGKAQRKATSDSRTGFARSGEGDVDASALHSIASSCSDTSLAPCAMNLSRYLPHNLGLCVGAGAPAGDVREQEACLPEAAAAALHALLCEPRELRPAEPHRATPPQAFQQWRRRRWRQRCCRHRQRLGGLVVASAAVPAAAAAAVAGCWWRLQL